MLPRDGRGKVLTLLMKPNFFLADYVLGIIYHAILPTLSPK
jgi:hypothetical protein